MGLIRRLAFGGHGRRTSLSDAGAGMQEYFPSDGWNKTGGAAGIAPRVPRVFRSDAGRSDGNLAEGATSLSGSGEVVVLIDLTFPSCRGRILEMKKRAEWNLTRNRRPASRLSFMTAFFSSSVMAFAFSKISPSFLWAMESCHRCIQPRIVSPTTSRNGVAERKASGICICCMSPMRCWAQSTMLSFAFFVRSAVLLKRHVAAHLVELVFSIWPDDVFEEFRPWPSGASGPTRSIALDVRSLPRRAR